MFTDSFSYPDGPLVLVSQGKWKTHSGTDGQVEVRSGRVYLSQTRTEDVSALLIENGAIGPTNAAALYARFKVSFSGLPSGANGAYFAHFKDSSTTTGLRCRVFGCTNGAPAGYYRLGISAAANAPGAIYPQDLQLQAEYRVVCRLVLSNNVSTLWLNPKAETDPSVTSTDQATAKTVTAFAFRESLASGAGIGELSVDDVVITTSFAETALVTAPSILVQPVTQTVQAGKDVRLFVEAGGAEPITYQWLFNGLELPGATSPLLLLRSVSITDAGRYEAVATNAGGLAASAPAILTVLPGELAVGIQVSVNDGIELRWAAAPDQTYSVLAGELVNQAFDVLSAGLTFPDGLGLFVDPIGAGSARFYQICSP